MIRMCLLKFCFTQCTFILQDHQSDVQLLPLPLFGNVDLLMDLLCVSEADSTFKAYYAGFISWEKLLQMVLTCWRPRKSVSCCIYLSSLIQTSRTVGPGPLLPLTLSAYCLGKHLRLIV